MRLVAAVLAASMLAGAARARSFFAACPRGLEVVLARELRAAPISAQNVEEARAGCWFDGDSATGMDAVLWLRSANRVMELLATERAPPPPRADETTWFTKELLFDFARTLPWERQLTTAACGVREIEDCTFAVDATIGSVDRSLSNTHFTALTVKNALVDVLRDAHGGRRPSVDTRAPHLPLQVHVHEDEAWLFRYLSPYGSLHRRGYREQMHVAALRENLAAGLLLEAGLGTDLDPDTTVLCDPMCGSGTLGVEAALIATHTAPGLLRWGAARGASADDDAPPDEPPLCFWPDYDRAQWAEHVERAAAAVTPSTISLQLNDHHAGALRLAQQALRRVGLESLATLTCEDVLDYRPSRQPTLVITNPPWDLRLSASGDGRRTRDAGPQSRGRGGDARRTGADESWLDELASAGRDGDGDGESAWSALGRFLKRNSGEAGLDAWLLCGNSRLTQHLRMKTSRKMAIECGGVDLRFLKYAVLPPKAEWLGADGRRAFADGDGGPAGGRWAQGEQVAQSEPLR